MVSSTCIGLIVVCLYLGLSERGLDPLTTRRPLIARAMNSKILSIDSSSFISLSFKTTTQYNVRDSVPIL